MSELFAFGTSIVEVERDGAVLHFGIWSIGPSDSEPDVVLSLPFTAE